MAERYQIGRWHFDPTEPVLRDGSDERRLEDRAARTLELLCRRRGEVVGKQELIDAVWHGRSVSSNSLAVVVGNLRRAVDDDPGEPRYIVTINKRGYRLAGGDAQLEGDSTARGRNPWPSSPISLAIIAAVAVSALGAALFGSSVRPVELVVEPVRNDTGAPSLDPLARSLSAVMVDGAVRIGGGRVVPRTAARDSLRRLALGSRLINWNGAPELAMTATDLDSGRVVWSGFAAGPTKALARNTTQKLGTLALVLKR